MTLLVRTAGRVGQRKLNQEEITDNEAHVVGGIYSQFYLSFFVEATVSLLGSRCHSKGRTVLQTQREAEKGPSARQPRRLLQGSTGHGARWSARGETAQKPRQLGQGAAD